MMKNFHEGKSSHTTMWSLMLFSCLFFPCSCYLIWKQSFQSYSGRREPPFALSNGISLVWWDLCQLKGHALILRSNTGYILIFSHFFVCLHCENIRPDNGFPNGAVIYMTWTLIKIQYGHWLPLCRGPLFCEKDLFGTPLISVIVLWGANGYCAGSGSHYIGLVKISWEVMSRNITNPFWISVQYASVLHVTDML